MTQLTSSSTTERTFFGHPRALAPLFMSEMWERFSYYGIRPLLVLFMTATLLQGGYGFDRPTAASIVGIFAGSVYLAALPGGWLADHILGQARAMWWGSILIALGHFSIALSMGMGKPAFFAGLGLIVIGTGLFKTCATVMVGRLYDSTDPRRDAGYSLFYMGINIGGLAAPLVTGYLADRLGWEWGFGAGGIGMLISLLIYRFAAKATFDRLANDLPPVQTQTLLKILAVVAVVAIAVIGLVLNFPATVLADGMAYAILTVVIAYVAWLFTFNGLTWNEKKRVIMCLLIFVTCTMFWAASEQQPTALNLFARDFTDRNVMGFVIPTAWFQSLNPVTIVIFAPIIGALWQRWPQQGLTASLGKFMIGFLLCAIAFGIMYVAAGHILAGAHVVSPLWLVAAYFLFSVGELFVGPVGMAATSLLAPKRLQGQMIGIYFMSLAMGNLIAGILGGSVNPEHIAEMPILFGQTAGALIVCIIVLLVLAPVMKRWVRE